MKYLKIAIFPLLLAIFAQCFTYYFAQLINYNWHHYDLTIHGFDDVVPFWSWMIIFYVIAYPFWYLFPLVIFKYDQKGFYNYIIGTIICCAICFIIFLVFPTTNTRPNIDQEGSIFDRLVNLIYQADSPAMPNNLFPSMHCIISWNIFYVIRRNKRFKLPIRIGVVTLVVLICLSTQFIKQHYIVDFIMAIIISEGIMFLTTRLNLGKIFYKEKLHDNQSI